MPAIAVGAPLLAKSRPLKTEEMRLPSRTSGRFCGILCHNSDAKGQRSMHFFSNRRNAATARHDAGDAGRTDATTTRKPMIAPLPFGPSRMQPCTELFEEDSGITGVFYPEDHVGRG